MSCCRTFKLIQCCIPTGSHTVLRRHAAGYKPVPPRSPFFCKSSGFPLRNGRKYTAYAPLVFRPILLPKEIERFQFLYFAYLQKHGGRKGPDTSVLLQTDGVHGNKAFERLAAQRGIHNAAGIDCVFQAVDQSLIVLFCPVVHKGGIFYHPYTFSRIRHFVTTWRRTKSWNSARQISPLSSVRYCIICGTPPISMKCFCQDMDSLYYGFKDISMLVCRRGVLTKPQKNSKKFFRYVFYCAV